MKKEDWTRRIQIEEVDRRGGGLEKSENELTGVVRVDRRGGGLAIGGIDRLVKKNTAKTG